MSEKSKIHQGHRERVRERFLKTGFDGFSDVNILEMILFYSVPRKDTNELAHTLLDEFGSLSGVLDASYDSLIKIKGISPNTASHLTMITKLFQVYETDKFKKEKIILKNSETTGQYCISKFIGETNEKLYAILLDNNNAVIKSALISKGTPNTASVNLRLIVEQVVVSHATSVILAHNHPNGVAAPSSDDIQSTLLVSNTLSNINVRLLDHIIVADRDYIALAKVNKFRYLFK